MRSEDDATGMPGPVHAVQCSIIFRNKWIARIAEDGLDEIEIANEAAGCEESDFHRFVFAIAGHLRADQWTYQQGHKGLGRDRIGLSERQLQKHFGRCYGVLKQFRKGVLRNASFVTRNRQPTFGYMKRSLRGSSVGAGIMENAICHAVGADQFVFKAFASIG